MTADLDTSIRASRGRVPRSRGAASGFLLLVLGAWAALVPFIGPYLNIAFTPSPNTAWHWTSDRGWYHVLPGALTVLGGLLLLFSRSRAVTIFGAWLAALSGAWLIVGPALAQVLKLSPGQPDPSSRNSVQALAALLFFYGIGALILFLASLALGRLSVHSVRDVRAAERRVAAEEAAAAEEEQRLAREREASATRDRDAVPAGDRDNAAGRDRATTGAYDRTGNGAAATQHLPTTDGSGAHSADQPTQYQGQPNQGQQYQGQHGQGYPGQYPGQPGQPSHPGQQAPGQQPYASAPPPPEQRG
jgi:hypothetical protein